MKVNLYLTTLEDIDVLITEVFTVKLISTLCRKENITIGSSQIFMKLSQGIDTHQNNVYYPGCHGNRFHSFRAHIHSFKLGN